MRRRLQALWEEVQRTGDISSIALVQRRHAIQSFLDNPVATLQLYPQLGDDLISFFSQSINPHVNDSTGLPVRGREADYEKWQAAHKWAQLHIKN